MENPNRTKKEQPKGCSFIVIKFYYFEIILTLPIKLDLH